MHYYTIQQTYQGLKAIACPDSFLQHFADLQNTPEWNTALYMETPGDLSDINKYIDRHLNFLLTDLYVQYNTPILEMVNIWNFINAAQFICPPSELDSIDTIAIFKHNYPHLYETFVTWAWG